MQYELKHNLQYSEIVAGNVQHDRGRTRIQAFYSRSVRSNYDRNKEDLEKLIRSNMFEADVRLVRIAQEEVMPADCL